jgi:hypothetical protein
LRNNRRLAAAITTAVATTLIISAQPAHSVAADTLTQADTAHFQDVALNYFQERADLITGESGSKSHAFNSLDVGSTLRTQLARDAANIVELRERFDGADESYTDSDVTVTVEGIQLERDTATARVREVTRLFQGEHYEAYSIEHNLIFTRNPTGWRLDVAAVIGEGGLLPPTQTQGEWKSVWSPPAITTPRVVAEAIDEVAADLPGATDLAPDLIEPASHRGYDKKAMAAYARKHALNNNSNYRRYDVDCTNFISQAVRAGGWKMINSKYRRSDHRRWNYGKYTSSTSYSS